MAALLAIAGTLVVVGLSVATGVIERKQGCEPGDDRCFGPDGTYTTVFDAPLDAQSPQALVAIGVTLGLFGAASAVHRRRRIGFPLAYRVGLLPVSFLLVFLLVTYLSPTVLVYG